MRKKIVLQPITILVVLILAIVAVVEIRNRQIANQDQQRKVAETSHTEEYYTAYNNEIRAKILRLINSGQLDEALAIAEKHARNGNETFLELKRQIIDKIDLKESEG